jgi:hypothetical protein
MKGGANFDLVEICRSGTEVPAANSSVSQHKKHTRTIGEGRCVRQSGCNPFLPVTGTYKQKIRAFWKG